MRLRRNWARSMRGRLVLWYLGILAALLLGLCVFQTFTLTDYLRTSTALNMSETAQGELAVVGPCFIATAADLRHNAQPVASLLSSIDMASTIVTPAGHVLAISDGSPPAGPRPAPIQPLIRNLIASSSRVRVSGGREGNTCPQMTRHAALSLSSPASIRRGDVLAVAVPLGPAAHPSGYAILERSMAAQDATLWHTRVILWAAVLAVLLIAACVALPIINRALRPLQRVTETAEAIAAGSLEQRANLAPSFDEVGRLGRAFDAMVDRLQEALSAATTSEEQMRRFVADASHELRTPLTAVRGTAQVLLRSTNLERQEVEEALSAIHAETVRLSRLVDDLLQLSRLDAGQTLHPHPVPVSRFLRDFVMRYAAAWPGRAIEIDTGELNGEEAQVDPDALTRVLTNLVDNAARYSAPGRPITIAGKPGTREVKLLVKDEGPGLPTDEAQHLFERFYRGSKSRSRQSGGSGLGLAIVQALVQQSRGAIRLDTAPDRGTIVEFSLPLASHVATSNHMATMSNQREAEAIAVQSQT